jgi:hypothetical protein
MKLFIVLSSDCDSENLVPGKVFRAAGMTRARLPSRGSG